MIGRFETALVELLKRELQPRDEDSDEDLEFQLATGNESQDFHTKDLINFTFQPPTEKNRQSWAEATISIFLHDIRENNKLRGQRSEMKSVGNDDRVQQRGGDVNFDLHYLITVWIAEGQQTLEHDILFAVMSALLRNDGLPRDLQRRYLPEVAEGVSFKVAQYDTHVNPRDIWSIFGGDMRVSIDLVATVTFNPYHYEPPVPLVREVDLIFHDMNHRTP